MSEQITITIETGNAAFADSPTGEIARILRELARDFELCAGPRGGDDSVLRDINGNRCGTVEVKKL